MCGIIGMISNKPVISDMVTALIAQQHRGRQSTGIIGSHTNRKRFGLRLRIPEEAKYLLNGNRLIEQELMRCTDNVAIGHNRYATSGDDLNYDAQPMFETRPGVALAHNGQIENYHKLTEIFENNPYEFTFASNCDLEVLLNSLTVNLRGEKFKARTMKEFVCEKLFPALRKTMNPKKKLGVNGAYSAVALIAGYGLLAFKDPHGIRPLFFAKDESDGTERFVFGSETRILQKLNMPNEFIELAPGEAIFVDFEYNIYKESIFALPEKQCVFEYPYFAHAHSMLNGGSINRYRRELGRILGEENYQLKDRIDIVIFVPKSSIPVAKGLADSLGKEQVDIIIAEPAYADVRAFQGSDAYARHVNILRKLSFDIPEIPGRRIAVVDDSIVRGEQSEVVTKKLFEYGAKEVHFFSAFPPFRSICAGGIDVPSMEELAIYGKTIEEVRQRIGATTLNYISLDGFLNAINLSQDRACLGCTLGEYPFDMSDYRNFQERRIEDKKAHAT